VGPRPAVNSERRGRFKRLSKSALRSRPVGEAVRRIAALRGRSLVLVYHRIVASEPPTRGVIPFVASSLFRRHVEALSEIGEIASLETLLGDGDRHAKPRFALTFDDDFVTHVDGALPVLRALNVPATFFLSGRSLHGLGSYWFERLERLIDDRGLREVGRLLGTPSDGLDELVTTCEGDPALQKVLEAETTDTPHHLGRAHIEELSAAGMPVGFHTLHHQSLTHLGAADLEAALTVGRRELEDVVGRPLVHFAYPHGKADQRTAAAVHDAGFEAAWTGRPHAIHHRNCRYLLGRWEPGPVSVDDLLIGAAIRLNRRTSR
jgi:peptidoglycan/xylan/chitin deacetylase (PgdA/CDA1 family)